MNEQSLFSNNVSNSIVESLQSTRERLQESGMDLYIVSESNPVKVRNGKSMYSINPDDIDERLAGFIDLRLQPNVMLTGFDPSKYTSGVSCIILDKTTDRPLAVTNHILYNPNVLKQARFGKLNGESLEIVGIESLGINPENSFVLTPGWHYVRQDSRLNVGIARAGLSITQRIIKELTKTNIASNTRILVEQNGIADDYYIDSNNPLKLQSYDDFKTFNPGVNVDLSQIQLKGPEGKLFRSSEIIGKPHSDASMVANASYRMGMRQVPNIVHLETMGPVFVRDLVQE